MDSSQYVDPVAASSPSPGDPDRVRRAVLLIQAHFRGFRERRAHASRRIPPHHFPHSGPLVDDGISPPVRPRHNPLFLAATHGDNDSCGCPSAAPSSYCAPTMQQRFGPSKPDDVPPLPMRLEGIYTQQQWLDLQAELDSTLRTTWLPCCPAGLMLLFPIVGCFAFSSWRSRLAKRRTDELVARLDRENARLRQWGLWWVLIPVSRHVLARGGGHRDVPGGDGFVIELLFGAAAAKATAKPSCLRAAVAGMPSRQVLMQHQRGAGWKSPSAAPPARQVMGSDQATGHGSHRSSRGHKKHHDEHQLQQQHSTQDGPLLIQVVPAS